MTDISNDTAQTATSTTPVPMSQLIIDEFLLRTYGFVGNGVSNQLQSISMFGGMTTTGWTLAMWQSHFFLFATDLTNELDGLAVQAAINSVTPGQSYQIIFPAGTWLSSVTITTGGAAPQGNVRVRGAGQAVTIMLVVTAGIDGWQHNYGLNPAVSLCSLQMEDMAITTNNPAPTGTSNINLGTNVVNVGLNITCTTTRGKGVAGGLGAILSRLIVSGYKTISYSGFYWKFPIVIHGGGGASLTKVLVGDSAASYVVTDVGNALTFIGSDTNVAHDIGLTNIIVQDCDFSGYQIGVAFITTAQYGIQGTWICNCNIGGYQGISYSATYSATTSSPQNFILDCEIAFGYNGAISARGVNNLTVRNLSCFFSTGNNVTYPAAPNPATSFAFFNCYNVIIDSSFFLLDLISPGTMGVVVPYAFDFDANTFDVLLKDNYVIASKPPTTFIRTQAGSSHIVERNTTFQNGFKPATIWLNGNSTKNGCIIESWINLYNNATGLGGGTRCTVDNLGTITYTSTKALTTTGNQVAVAIPQLQSINLFDEISVVTCINGDGTLSTAPVVALPLTVNTSFKAEFVGITSATMVRLNFVVSGI